jgi:O-6-methylguanine DNA methyltransferase
MKNEINEAVCSTSMKTPVGRIWIIGRGKKLLAAELEPRFEALQNWMNKRHSVSMEPAKTERGSEPILERAKDALKRYFSGELGAPARIPLELEGSTLQRKVWDMVRSIPPGQTISYADLAKNSRNRGAFRAVGAANGANRCAIFIPCHRVVSSSGSLQGYGGGLDAKGWLLRHEGVANDGTKIDIGRE